MKKKEKKELEKFVQNLPPEIATTLGIVLAFYLVNMIRHFALPRKFDKRKIKE
jgi:hypothetical protein